METYSDDEDKSADDSKSRLSFEENNLSFEDDISMGYF